MFWVVISPVQFGQCFFVIQILVFFYIDDKEEKIWIDRSNHSNL